MGFIKYKMTRNYIEFWTKFEADLLEDADNVVTELGLWEWLKSTSWNEVVKSETINIIMNKLKNGESIMFVMKNLHYIGQYGWESHCGLRKK